MEEGGVGGGDLDAWQLQSVRKMFGAAVGGWNWFRFLLKWVFPEMGIPKMDGENNGKPY